MIETKIKFGDMVRFAHEYRRCGATTVNLTDKDVVAQMEAAGIECEEQIKVKDVFKLKAPRFGVFLGLDKINTSIYYEHNDNTYREWYSAHKDQYVTVAKVMCEGIAKMYYVPLFSLKQN